MKKYIILLILLIPWQYAMAGVITEGQARKHAAEFFSSIEKSTKATDVSPGDFKLLCTFPVVETKSTASEPALFVFEREYGGYAIVAGDDVARPILGFSPDGYFPVNDMPDNMRAMLQWYSDIIEYARSQHWRSQVRQSSDGIENSQKVLLRTAQWHQGSPFNDLVPVVNGEKPPIGCVATAIAIIMRYHRWPMIGTGVIPAYDSWDSGNKVYRHIDEIPLDHIYNWDLMPDYYTYSYTFSEEEKAQIARFMFDVAAMCEMHFSKGGSAGDDRLFWRLIENFGYDKSMQYLARSTYIIDTLGWEQLIKDELDEGRPVFYSGLTHNSNTGHAYVIDGYFDRFFSINWGWGGMGYAALDPTYNGNREWRPDTGGTRSFYSLTPIEGFESELEPYYDDQNMIIHIMPDQGGNNSPSIFVYKSVITFLDYHFQVGRLFSMQTRIGKSDSIPSITREFRFALFDKGGQLLEFLSPAETQELTFGFGCPVANLCTIKQHLSDGDRVVVAVLDTESGKWDPVPSARWHQIVFTSRPLSELIEVGYVDPPTPDKGYLKDISVTFYKDICWDIWDNNTNTSLFTTTIDPYSSVLFYDKDKESIVCSVLDPDDTNCDRVVCRLAIPSGSYTLRANNPVTGEKMEIKLEL